MGLVAISYAAGPALIAAARPGLRDKLRFVLAIGGYHDIARVVTYFTTGFYRVGGHWRHGEPNAYGKWVFVKSNAGRLTARGDRALLAAIAEARLVDPEAEIETRGLGPEGLAVMALVTNRDRERVAALIAALPAAIRDDMAALDPAAADLEAMPARLLLIHGRDDPVVPYSESLDLARRLGAARVSLTLVDGLWHVDPDFSLADRIALWEAMIELLEIRDGIAEP